MSGQQPSVVVIGAGPVGLAAAAHLLERGLEPLVLERGDDVATNVADWAHVRVFSPWSFNVDDAALRLLEPLGWEAPDPEHHPTGGELVEGYLRPLAATPALSSRIRFGAPVVQVTRAGFDKMKTDGREAAPFQVFVETDAGEERIGAVAVVDASGTYATPNPLGAGGDAELAERGRLGALVGELVERGALEVVTGFAIDRVGAVEGGVMAAAGEREIGPFDEVIAVTGYRPDLGILRELRLGLDSAVESPTELAPLIDPNIHSCGS